MRKIKDNGRTLVLTHFGKHCGCHKCECTDKSCQERPYEPDDECGFTIGHWRETLPSKLSRLIKRMVRK